MNKFIFVILMTSLQQPMSCTRLQSQNSQKNRRILTQQALALQELLLTDRRMRLAIFDAKTQKDEGFLWEWEQHENGSTLNAIKAYNQLFELFTDDYNETTPLYQAKLSLKVLSEIRKNFKDQEGNYSNQQQGYFEGDLQEVTDINGTESISFGIGEKKQLVKKLQPHLKDLKQRLGEAKKGSADSLDPYIIQYRKDEDFVYITTQIKASKERKTEWINKLFDTYENVSLPQLGDIQQNQDEYLKVLALLIIDLERIHPYMDFNCRTFAVFLLNKELIRHNLTPTIMEDPNNFDFMNTEESVEQIKIGQRNYSKLTGYGKNT